MQPSIVPTPLSSSTITPNSRSIHSPDPHSISTIYRNQIQICCISLSTTTTYHSNTQSNSVSYHSHFSTLPPNPKLSYNCSPNASSPKSIFHTSISTTHIPQ